MTKEQQKLLDDRRQWQAKYVEYLNRKNKFFDKLQKAGRTTDSSKKYQELATECKKYWQLLHDSLPAYRAIIESQ